MYPDDGANLAGPRGSTSEKSLMGRGYSQSRLRKTAPAPILQLLHRNHTPPTTGGPIRGFTAMTPTPKNESIGPLPAAPSSPETATGSAVAMAVLTTVEALGDWFDGDLARLESRYAA